MRHWFGTVSGADPFFSGHGAHPGDIFRQLGGTHITDESRLSFPLGTPGDCRVGWKYMFFYIFNFYRRIFFSAASLRCQTLYIFFDSQYYFCRRRLHYNQFFPHPHEYNQHGCNYQFRAHNGRRRYLDSLFYVIKES